MARIILLIFTVLSCEVLYAESICLGLPTDLTGIYEAQCVGRDIDSNGQVQFEYEHNLFEIRQAPHDPCIISVDRWVFGALPFAEVNGSPKQHHFNNEYLLTSALYISGEQKLLINESVNRDGVLKQRSQTVYFKDGKPENYLYRQDTYNSEKHFEYKCKVLEKRPT